METTITVFVTRSSWVLFDYHIRIANCSNLWSVADIHKEIRKFKMSRVGLAPSEKGEPAFKRVGGNYEK
jgi:hypothetical protein